MEEKDKKRWLKDLKKVQEASHRFWEELYPQKSWEEKLAYWQNIMEKAILEQEQKNLPSFSAFNKDWYTAVLEQEPKIEAIIHELFKTTWAGKDEAPFWEAIQQD